MKKYKLGELIELTDERNSMGRYSLENVKGLSTEKNFIETKANMDGVSLDTYKVVNFSPTSTLIGRYYFAYHVVAF